jgi:hypothetical protein
LDVTLRLSRNVATAVEVQDVVVAVSENTATVTTDNVTTSVSLDNGVVKLSYTVRGPLATGNDPTEKSSTSLSHTAGQYCYVNVPNISALEWHPFSISSAPSDSVTTHHIAVQGGVASKSFSARQWTAKLYTLAENMASSSASSASASLLDSLAPPSKSLTVNIDGPYGLPPAFENYTHVLLVGGGIGITPLHSCIRQMYLSARTEAAAKNGGRQGRSGSKGPDYADTGVSKGRLLADDDAIGNVLEHDDDVAASADADNKDPYSNLENIRLVWSVRSVTMATSMFSDTVCSMITCL